MLSVAALAQNADLGVQKLGPATAPAASDVSYEVTLFNAGPDDASGVVFSDPIPAGMSFVSATQHDGPAFSCDATIACSTASFPAGSSATFTFVFHIDSGTEFLNTATVTSETFDPNEENDQSSAFTTVTMPSADMSVSKSAASPTAAPDSDVTFYVTLTNNGPDSAADVVLTDNLPAPLTFVSFTQDSGPAMSCGASTCTVASFPAFASATFSLVGHVPPGTPGETEITNSATVESENDPFDENDVASITVTVSTADVRVEKTGPPAAVAGETISYTVTVTNDGPDVARNVTVDDPQVCASVNCGLGPMSPGSSVVLNADVTIPPDATSWSNTATVSTHSVDPDPSNNTATVETTVTPSADLRVEKTGPATVVASTDVVYTITVTNDGPSQASDVVLTDTLPAGTTFVSSSCGSNPCAIGTLAAGGTLVVTLTVNVAANATGPLVNRATVSSSAPDPAPGNNTTIFETAVTPAPADLSIAKTADRDVAVVGSNVTYTIVVMNDGPGEALNVVVTDDLPAGSTLVSAPETCSGTTTITCTVGTLASGGSAAIELVVMMPATPGTVTNDVRVSTDSDDPAEGNDAASAAVDAHLPFEAVPALSPAALALLALSIASAVLVALRRVS